MSFRLPRVTALALTAATVLGLSLVAGPASASNTYPTLADTNVRSSPSSSAPIVTVVTKGTQLAIDCYVIGQTVNGTSIWNHIPAQGWVSDSMILTGSDEPVVPKCSTYDRRSALKWARAHARDAEKTYKYQNDCTWFVSNALWKGGLPKTPDWTNWTITPSLMADKPYPGPSKAAAHADWFKNALVNSGMATLTELDLSDPTAGGAELGDVILYDWDRADETKGADGFADHAAMVSTLNTKGWVGIAQHSKGRLDKNWVLDPATGSSIANDGARAYLLRIIF